jgi:hypothetical protein
VKRFLAFAYDSYYPCGGVGDIVGAFDTVEEAQAATQIGRDWAEVLDTQTGEVWANSRGPWELQPKQQVK